VESKKIMSHRERAAKRRGTVLLGAAAAGVLMAATPGCSSDDPCSLFRPSDGGAVLIPHIFGVILLSPAQTKELPICEDYLADGGK
jgi:hypothetical protein